MAVCSPLTRLELIGDVLKQSSQLNLVLLEDSPTEVGQTCEKTLIVFVYGMGRHIIICITINLIHRTMTDTFYIAVTVFACIRLHHHRFNKI